MTYTHASKRGAKYRKAKRIRMELEMSPKKMENLKKTTECCSGLIQQEVGKLHII